MDTFTLIMAACTHDALLRLLRDDAARAPEASATALTEPAAGQKGWGWLWVARSRARAACVVVAAHQPLSHALVVASTVLVVLQVRLAGKRRPGGRRRRAAGGRAPGLARLPRGAHCLA